MLLRQAVDVVLNVRIARIVNVHGVVQALVAAILILPPVGHAVAVGVLCLFALKPAPRRGHADGQLVLVGDELTLLAERKHLVDHVAVGQVAVRQRSAHVGQQFFYELIAAPLLQSRIVVGRSHAVATTVTREERGVEHAVAVGVLPVVVAVEVEVAVAARQAIAAHGGTVDEQVVLNVHVARALRVATHVVGSVLPVVHQVVHVLVHTLHLEVSRAVVHQQDAVQGDVVGLHQSAGRVSHQSLADNGVHQRDVRRCRSLVVPVYREVLVLSPGKRAVVEDHVLSVGNAGTVLVFRAHSTHAEAHVAYNQVVGTREAHAVAIDGDALAGSCLSCHVEVLGKHDARVYADDAAHVEHDDAVWLAHGIAQRSCSRVVQISHMIDAARTSAGCKASPALCTREGQLLGKGSDK